MAKARISAEEGPGAQMYKRHAAPGTVMQNLLPTSRFSLQAEACLSQPIVPVKIGLAISLILVSRERHCALDMVKLAPHVLQNICSACHRMPSTFADKAHPEGMWSHHSLTYPCTR